MKMLQEYVYIRLNKFIVHCSSYMKEKYNYNCFSRHQRKVNTYVKSNPG